MILNKKGGEAEKWRMEWKSDSDFESDAKKVKMSPVPTNSVAPGPKSAVEMDEERKEQESRNLFTIKKKS